MAHTLPIHLDRIENALKATGVSLKRTKVMAIAAAAFGYRNQNALAAASRVGELTPPPAERLSTMRIPDGRILHVLRDPTADRIYGMEATVPPSRSDEIGISPYGNLLDMPDLPGAADDDGEEPGDRVILWHGRVTGSHGIAGTFWGSTIEEYRRDLAAWCREHWPTDVEESEPQREHGTNAETIAAFFGWNEEYVLDERIVSEQGGHSDDAIVPATGPLWGTFVGSGDGMAFRSFDASRTDADRKLAAWCRRQSEGRTTATDPAATDQDAIRAFFAGHPDMDLARERVDLPRVGSESVTKAVLRADVGPLVARIEGISAMAAGGATDRQIVDALDLGGLAGTLRGLYQDDRQAEGDTSAIADERAVRDGWRLERGVVCVELTNLGEGEDGEYDPNDPDDRPYLRFELSARRKTEWEEVDDSSYCVRFAPDSPVALRRALMDRIMDEVHDAVTGGQSVKRLCERLSWLTPADLAPGNPTHDAPDQAKPDADDARLVVLVRFCDRDGNGEVIAGHEAEVDVTDRFLALEPDEMRRLARGNDDLTAAMLEDRIEFDGTKWTGAFEAWVTEDAILDFFEGHGWQIHDMKKANLDHQVADFREAKAGWIAKVAAELSDRQAGLRVATAVSALMQLTDDDLARAIREETHRRRNRSAFEMRLRRNNPGIAG